MIDVLVVIADHRVMGKIQLARPKRVAEVLQAIVADMRGRGLDNPTLKTLTSQFIARASYCTQILRRKSLPDWSRRPY